MQEKDLHIYEAIRNPLNIKQERESALPQNGSDNEQVKGTNTDVKLPLKRNQSGVLTDKQLRRISYTSRGDSAVPGETLQTN